MVIKTYQEILNELCDIFDSYIYPKTISRSNTNFIYLLLKAIAKGFEIINNTVYAASKKFDPASCDIEDLESIAKLVGTERKKGKASGLQIIVTNIGDEPVTLQEGTYEYYYTTDIVFSFTTQSIQLEAGQQTIKAAYSKDIGKFYVETNNSIVVTRTDGQAIPRSLQFSCLDNTALLGYDDESDLDFRKRILTDTERIDTLQELELKLKNLPYLFDAKLFYNWADSPVTIDDITIDPYKLLVVINGEPRSEIAEIVAKSTFYQTVLVDPNKVIYYSSSVLYQGKYPIYYAEFSKNYYDVKVTYKYNSAIIPDFDIKNQISVALNEYKYKVTHTTYITEAEFYEKLLALNLASVKILNIELIQDSVIKPYIESSVLQIPVLNQIIFDGAEV